MKVFISSAKKDLFVATALAEKIESLGISVFLSQRDTVVGDDKLLVLKQAFDECDEFLVLVSDAVSVSGWIHYELGFADALGKRVIPVLFSVDAKEVPEVLVNRVTIDLNEIDRYLQQLKLSIADDGNVGQSVSESIAATTVASEPIKERTKSVSPGILVKLPSRQPDEAIRASENIGWVPGMNPYLGKGGKVLEVDEDNSAKLDVDGGKYWYAFEWLDPQ